MWVAFTPRDTVLVRDGRQFNAGADATAEPTRPWPSTLGGAVWTAFGERDVGQVRGPVLAKTVNSRWQPYFPMPADVVTTEVDRLAAMRLRPQPLAASTDLDDHCPQWLIGDGDPIGGWLPKDQISMYLEGTLFRSDGRLAIRAADFTSVDPFGREQRIGLAREDDRVARDRFLYQATHLRLCDNWAFLVECEDIGSAKPAGPVPLGGRGRLADVSEASGITWPSRPMEFPEGRVLVYVATPAIWSSGWRIPIPPGAQLIAAAVADAEPVASASPREGMKDSRMLRWAVPAGSVYLLKFTDPADAKRWCAKTHATAYGREPKDRLASTGFGIVLTGVWS